MGESHVKCKRDEIELEKIAFYMGKNVFCIKINKRVRNVLMCQNPKKIFMNFFTPPPALVYKLNLISTKSLMKIIKTNFFFEKFRLFVKFG